MYNVYNMKYNYCDLAIVVWADLSSLITVIVYFTSTTIARGKKAGWAKQCIVGSIIVNNGNTTPKYANINTTIYNSDYLCLRLDALLPVFCADDALAPG